MADLTINSVNQITQFLHKIDAPMDRCSELGNIVEIILTSHGRNPAIFCYRSQLYQTAEGATAISARYTIQLPTNWGMMARTLSKSPSHSSY